MGRRSGEYQVYAARSGTIVVVLESYSGWGERPQFTLNVLLERALAR